MAGLINLFPPTWDRRKVTEIKVTVYQLAVATIWWVDRDALSHPVYDPINAVARPREWAVIMFAIALGHAIGLCINGRRPVFSASVRLIAAICHFALAITLAWMFYLSGAPWGVASNLILVAWPAAVAADYVLEVLRRAVWRVRR